MAWPTTSVLDALNRTENPLSNGGKWSQPLDPGGAATMQDDGTTATSVSGASNNYSSAYWNVQTFTDSEVYATVATPSGNDWYLMARVTNPGNTSTYSGYYVYFQNTTVEIYRVDNNGVTSLNTGTITTLNGQSNVQLGFSVVGTTLTAYINGTSVLTTTDSTYSSGYIGMELDQPTAGVGFYNFGGGAPVTATTPSPLIETINWDKFPKARRLRPVHFHQG